MAVDNKVKVTEGTSKRGISTIFRELKAEIKRVTWPSKKDIKKATIAVAVLCFVYVVYVGLLDGVFGNLFELIFKIK
jgi:preprotein translocase subunit SecE